MDALKGQYDRARTEHETSQRVAIAFKLAISEEIQSAQEFFNTQIEIRDANIRELKLKFAEVTEINDYLKTECERMLREQKGNAILVDSLELDNLNLRHQITDYCG